jgi:hypothetical protein
MHSDRKKQMEEEKYIMVIMGISISLLNNNEFSERRLQEVLDYTFGGSARYHSFFENIEQIESKCIELIREIKNT